jgi:branched-chain amino acid transport system ATP-binding protein
MGVMLELINFHYSYGNIRAVRGVNMRVDEGEMVTLIGANGAGKTTTLQTISGLTRPQGIQGEIVFMGKKIQGMRGSQVSAMGIMHVLEGRHVFSKLTVEENLYMGAYLRKDAARVKEDIQGVFARFPRLEERRTQLGGTLSGGEQQMLAIGRALVGKPKLMVLDEPSLGLAPIIMREIFEGIRKINQEGTTILFVEQNSKMALNSANRGYVMQMGEIVIHDTCENLLNNDDIKRAYLGGS